jgi:5-oxopent-3-ene-1,2,5-tricarboxylate decarboxylase/2-hydroxyhepta-2,4-diene-1,7-dioate isomerase
MNNQAIKGRVYGVILNDAASVAAMGASLSADPYKMPPKAPVLYIKPANTCFSAKVGAGGTAVLPPNADSVEVGATLALVIGRSASKVAAVDAWAYVAGVTLVADLSLPHDSYYRPAIREKCFDSSCALGSQVVPVTDISSLVARTEVDGIKVAERRFDDLVRDVPQLLADVTAFMTLTEGDMLLVGVPWRGPQAKVGSRVVVEVDGIERIEFALAASGASAARPGPATIFALGLNYADHARELAFNAPDKPLVFLKGGNTVAGENARTVRPADATYLHYECELAVRIGKAAKSVKRADAMDYVDAYAVANDYAIRDYLENYYRPNLKVKNRDACTPIGPWIPAAQVADYKNLALRTYVNGTLTQDGSTRDMIFDIPFLIEYLSEFMTLQPGDLILTGTPEGLADVKAGDEVVTEIEGIGRLTNFIVSE